MQSELEDQSTANEERRIMRMFWTAVIVFCIGLVIAILDLSIQSSILDLISWICMGVGVAAIIILLIVLPRLSSKP